MTIKVVVIIKCVCRIDNNGIVNSYQMNKIYMLIYYLVIIDKKYIFAFTKAALISGITFPSSTWNNL